MHAHNKHSRGRGPNRRANPACWQTPVTATPSFRGPGLSGAVPAAPRRCGPDRYCRLRRLDLACLLITTRPNPAKMSATPPSPSVDSVAFCFPFFYIFFFRAFFPSRRALTGEVMTPQRPDLVLSANIPHIEFDVLVRDGFDVEPDGGDGGHALIQLQFVEYRCCRISLGTTCGGDATYWSCRQHPIPALAASSPLSRTAWPVDAHGQLVSLHFLRSAGRWMDHRYQHLGHRGCFARPRTK